MTPYEAAMKRLELESQMAICLQAMWLHAEGGTFETAMECQFMYLLELDELQALPFSHEFYDMEYIAEYGSIK